MNERGSIITNVEPVPAAAICLIKIVVLIYFTDCLFISFLIIIKILKNYILTVNILV